MGQVVGAFGIPHNPHFPTWVAEGHPLAGEIERLYRPLADALEQLRPDALVYITSDHYNLFWETVPVFAVGTVARAHGASDYPELDRTLPIDASLARDIHAHLVSAGFDAARVQALELDHTFIAPLHFVMSGRPVPLVPVYVNAFVRPLPSARRCLALGRAIAQAIEARPAPGPETGRVAVAGSGSFSLEIGGPRISQDSHTGVPDPEWVEHVAELLRIGDVGRLVDEATDEQLERAGSAGGEILDWIAMLGTFDARPADYLEVQPQFGHAFASWILDAEPAPAGPKAEPAAEPPTFALDTFCRRVVHDPALRDALRADPAQALRAVTPSIPRDQIDALLAGDVGALSRLGANNFLLHQLGRWRVFGLDLPTYAERIREAYGA